MTKNKFKEKKSMSKGGGNNRLFALFLALVMVFTNLSSPLVFAMSDDLTDSSYEEDAIVSEVTDELDDIDYDVELEDLPTEEQDVDALYDPSQYIAESDTGDDVLTEIDEEMMDGFVLDPVIEQHIVDHFDENLTAFDELSFMGSITVRNNLHDSSAMQVHGVTTFEEMQVTDGAWFDSFLTMYLTSVPLYSLSADSNYFVAYVDTLFHNSDVFVSDYVFALNANTGETVNARFDSSTGLAYLPKALFIVDDTFYLGRVQVQLLQVQSVPNVELNAYVEVLTDTGLIERSSEIVGDFDHSITVDEADAFATTTIIDTGLNADAIEVFVNGFSVDNFEYNASTGEVTVYQDSASIISLRVETYGSNRANVDEAFEDFLENYEPSRIEIIDALDEGISPADISAFSVQQGVPTLTVGEVELRTGLQNVGGQITFNARYQYLHNTAPTSGNNHLGIFGGPANINDVANAVATGSGFNINNINIYTGSMIVPYRLIIGGVDDADFRFESPFRSVANVPSEFRHNGSRSVMNLPLICATVGIAAGSGGNNTTRARARNMGRFTQNGHTYVLIGFVTEVEFNQAGVGIVRFREVEDLTGEITIQKQSSHPDLVASSPDYSIEGAVFGIWETRAQAEAGGSAGRVGRWRTDDQGRGWRLSGGTSANNMTNNRTVEVDAGEWYYVRELVAPAGHQLDTTIHRVRVTENQANRDTVVTVTAVNEAVLGSIDIQKRSSGHNDFINGNSLYSLSGAVYGVWRSQADANSLNANTRLWTMTTNANGVANRDNVPLGTYYIREITPSIGHTLDPTIHRVTVTANNHQTRQVANSIQPALVNPPSMRLQKVDAEGSQVAQGGATLAGAQYTMRFFTGTSTTGTPARTWVFETNADGIIDFLDASFLVTGSDPLFTMNGEVVFPLGSFTLEETQAPIGYLRDTTVFVGHIRQDGNNARFYWAYSGNHMADGELAISYTPDQGIAHREQVIRGGVEVPKVDRDRDVNISQGESTLQGAVIEVRNVSNAPVLTLDGRTIEPNEVVTTITTGVDGIARTAENELPFGTFEAREIQSPRGYHLNAEWVYRFEIREEGVMVVATESLEQDVYRGGVEIEKADRELTLLERLGHWTGLRPAQGDATLADIQFDIRNVSTAGVGGDGAVVVDGELFQTGDVVYSIFTDYEVRDGELRVFARTAPDLLPFGTFEIQEVATNDSYLLTDGEPRRFEIREDGVIVTGTVDDDDLLFLNYVVRGDVEIEKWDIELDVSEAMVGTSLAGIEFEITNESENPVLVDGDVFEVGEVIMSIFSFWCDESETYVARTTGRVFPYGTYRITEVAGNRYYLLEEEVGREPLSFVFQIREDGSTVRHDQNDELMIFRNQVRRGDLAGVKITQGNAHRLSHIPFAIESHASGEVNVIISDENGEFSTVSTWNPRRYANINNHLLEMEENGEPIMNSNVYMHGSVWFGVGEFGTIAPVDNVLGALPYGRYTVREMQAENNQGFIMLEFEIYVTRHGHVINLGTLTNIPEPDPELPRFRIATQAHVGDEDRSYQYFWWGDKLYLYDVVDVEVCEVETGTPMRFRAELWNRTVDGELTTIYLSEYVHFEVGELADDGCFRDTFEVRTTNQIDTSEFARDSEFFWSETLYLGAASNEDSEPEWEEVYKHNPQGDDPNQTLFPRYATIATQAHLGDGSQQRFWQGNSINAHDIIEIAHVNVPDGTAMYYSVFLWAVPAGIDMEDVEAVMENKILIRYRLHIPYTVENVVMTFVEIFEDIDTSEWYGYELFFSENLYRQVENDEPQLVYEHNKNGQDLNQRLTPVPRPANVPEDSPVPPRLPQTGIASRTILFVVLGGMAIATTCVIIKAKRSKVSRINIGNKDKIE